jgi:hypothetical protein
VLDLCADLADEIKPTAGVWAGADWTRRTTSEPTRRSRP